MNSVDQVASLPAAPAAWSPAALWSSAFRPFFLLGALYGPLLMLHSMGIVGGFWSEPAAGLSLRDWHGHEIVFGFAAAIIVGVVLTALPSWAHTDEIDGARLQWLATLWVAGRVAMLSSLPVGIVALIDCLLFPAMAWMLAPQLLRAKNRLYLLLLPVLAGLFTANFVFHLGRAAADHATTEFGLRLAIHSIILLYVLKGGVLTPIFTGNALREKKRGEQAVFLPWLDALAVGAVVAFAATDLSGAPAAATGLCAAAACVAHGVRLARWQGWRVADVPLLLAMHMGYTWLVFAFALRAATEFGWGVPAAAWLHAFTVGSLGMMMIGLMTRVSLRHTGRPLRVPRPLLIAFALMGAAGVLRLAVAFGLLAPIWLAPTAILWASVFLMFLSVCGAMLWRPSLPQRGAARHG